MREFKLDQKMPCPSCGKSLDGALNPDSGEGPQSGDVTFCIYCHAMGVFRGVPVDSITRPTDDEETEFLALPGAQRVIAALAMMRNRG